jgi:hypothetical protein
MFEAKLLNPIYALLPAFISAVFVVFQSLRQTVLRG